MSLLGDLACRSIVNPYIRSSFSRREGNNRVYGDIHHCRDAEAFGVSARNLVLSTRGMTTNGGVPHLDTAGATRQRLWIPPPDASGSFPSGLLARILQVVTVGDF